MIQSQFFLLNEKKNIYLLQQSHFLGPLDTKSLKLKLNSQNKIFKDENYAKAHLKSCLKIKFIKKKKTHHHKHIQQLQLLNKQFYHTGYKDIIELSKQK